jgi:hypothetical protein
MAPDLGLPAAAMSPRIRRLAHRTRAFRRWSRGVECPHRLLQWLRLISARGLLPPVAAPRAALPATQRHQVTVGMVELQAPARESQALRDRIAVPGAPRQLTKPLPGTGSAVSAADARLSVSAECRAASDRGCRGRVSAPA